MLRLEDERVLVTGGHGFLGSYVVDELQGRCYTFRSSSSDLLDKIDVRRLFNVVNPTVVIHLAANVGGIGKNMRQPYDIAYSNLAMGMNVVEESRRARVKKVVLVGTVCSYPKFCPAPFSEDSFWDGYPEETNAPYGVAKKAVGVLLASAAQQCGLKSAYVVPVNLYGPRDNFDPSSSHVIPAMIRRFREAVAEGRSEVTCWGTGRATREFLHAADAARGIVLAARLVDTPEPINLGTGLEVNMMSLATLIAHYCGFRGTIKWDATKPDGQPRRVLDASRAKNLLGWNAEICFERGILDTIAYWDSVTSGQSSHRGTVKQEDSHGI